jgi:hypothetical protein
MRNHRRPLVQRAWAFHEKYKGGKSMILLISHPLALEKQKREWNGFGIVPGELKLASVQFCRKATRLCRAFQSCEHLPPKAVSQTRLVLDRAARYSDLLDATQPMDPTIISDVMKRGVSKPMDRLIIFSGEVGRHLRQMNYNIAVC